MNGFFCAAFAAADADVDGYVSVEFARFTDLFNVFTGFVSI
jgi:hypothetical protein